MPVVFKYSIPLDSLLGERSLNSLVFQPEYDENTSSPVYYFGEDGFLSSVQVCKVNDPVKGWEAILSFDVAKQYYAGEVIPKEALFLNEEITYVDDTPVNSLAKHSFWVSFENHNQPLMDDDKDNFPYVVLPHSVLDALLYLPPQKPYKQEAPIEPQGHPIKESVYRFIVLSPLIITFISWIISIILSSGKPFAFGLLVGILGIPFMAKWVIPKLKLVPSSEMNRKQEEYERKLYAYERNRDEYDDKLERYEILSPLYENCSRSDYVRHSLEVCLKQYSPPTFDQDLLEVKHGPAEQLFIRFLSGIMTEEYELLGTVKTPHYFTNYDARYYYPDIAIRENKTGLMIDIEIDEPYIAQSGTPIHCDRGPSDEDRNRALASDNWFIFRFSEEQIIRFPEICWAYVKAICSSFVSYAHFEQPSLLGFYQKRWDYYDARQMAESNYRLTYLPASVRESIRVVPKNNYSSSVEQDDDFLPF